MSKSVYELQRDATIARNRAKLVELGLERERPAAPGIKGLPWISWASSDIRCGVEEQSARGGGSILYLDFHLCESAAEGLEALINGLQAGCKQSNVDNNTPA